MNHPSSANLGMTPETGIVVSLAMEVMPEDILLRRQDLLASCLSFRYGRPRTHGGKADSEKQDSRCMRVRAAWQVDVYLCWLFFA